MKLSLPPPPAGSAAAKLLAPLVSSYCLLPHPGVVHAVDGPVLPSIRDHRRRGQIETKGEMRLVLDSNTTPRWSLLWTHGILRSAHPTGWTVAHVWTAAKDPDAYCRLANLVLMPEWLASFSDKDGPLAGSLRYHAFETYGWAPAGVKQPGRPEGYERIRWAYLEPQDSPLDLVRNRLSQLDNALARTLREVLAEPAQGSADPTAAAAAAGPSPIPSPAPRRRSRG